MSESIRGGERFFSLRVCNLTLRDKVHINEIRKALKDALLLWTKVFLLRWFGNVNIMPKNSGSQPGVHRQIF